MTRERDTTITVPAVAARDAMRALDRAAWALVTDAYGQGLYAVLPQGQLAGDPDWQAHAAAEPERAAAVHRNLVASGMVEGPAAIEALYERWRALRGLVDALDSGLREAPSPPSRSAYARRAAAALPGRIGADERQGVRAALAAWAGMAPDELDLSVDEVRDRADPGRDAGP